MSKEINKIFENGGILSKQIEGYEERQGQIEMAKDIKNFLDKSEKNIFIGEGPVGLGKSMVYLLSSLIGENDIRKKKIIVSTSSITLQNQLVEKDLKDVAEIIEREFGLILPYSSLKGIGNYVCLKNLNTINEIKDEWEDDFENVENLISTLEFDGEKPDEIDYELWNIITTNATECDKDKCKYSDKCYYLKQKRKAEKSIVVVVNHSLLAADIYIKKIIGGNAKVLPDYHYLIIDEIHELENSIASFFTKTLSEKVVKQIASRLIKSGNKIEDIEMSDRYRAQIATQLDKIISEMEQVDFVGLENKIIDIAKKYHNKLIEGSYDFSEWITAFKNLAMELYSIKYVDPLSMELVPPKPIQSYAEYLIDVCDRLKWISENDESIAIWSEGNPKYPKIKMTPININDFLEDFWIFGADKFILTSATISVDNSFDFIIDRLGINKENVKTGIYNSAFDYMKQAKMIIPKGFNPKKKDIFDNKVFEGIKQIVKNGYNKTLILFTSYKQMNGLIPKIKLEFSNDYLVLEQNQNLSKRFILNKFRKAEKSILVAQAASFGTGVDVKGDKNIILVKLNFDNPTDPLFLARSNAIEKAGGSAFMDLSIPNVSIRTKQQLGRSIRSSSDRAFMAIFDERLIRTFWGKKIYRSLPKMKLYKKI